MGLNQTNAPPRPSASAPMLPIKVTRAAQYTAQFDYLRKAEELAASPARAADGFAKDGSLLVLPAALESPSLHSPALWATRKAAAPAAGPDAGRSTDCPAAPRVAASMRSRVARLAFVCETRGRDARAQGPAARATRYARKTKSVSANDRDRWTQRKLPRNCTAILQYAIPNKYISRAISD